MVSRCLLLVLLTTLVGCGRATDVELERLQGKWDAVDLRNDGREIAPAGRGCEFAGTHMTNFKHDDPPGPFGSIRIDGTKQPKWIDIHDEKRNLDIRGIYEFDGEILKICLNEQAKTDTQRPTKFTSESGSNQILMQLRRRPK